MSRSVRADPVKLRALAKKLRSAGDQLEQVQRQVQGALRAADWHDHEGRRFADIVSHELKAVTAAGHKLKNEHPRALEKKAQALDDFQR
ncbi:MAG: hypothetical protein ACTHLH_07690 [Solirubrobacterales bacterium]